jgi:hypothetical protein
MMKKIYAKPKTPTASLAAMSVLRSVSGYVRWTRACHCPRYAMGDVSDPRLLQETFDFILNQARDQDVKIYFRGLRSNAKGRRPLSKFYKDNYEVVRRHLLKEVYSAPWSTQLHSTVVRTFQGKH